MKLPDIRIVLIALQLTIVVAEVATITAAGGWSNASTWGGILLGFNFGLAVMGWLLYRQGQFLDEVLHAYKCNIDFLLELQAMLEHADRKMKKAKKTAPKSEKK